MFHEICIISLCLDLCNVLQQISFNKKSDNSFDFTFSLYLYFVNSYFRASFWNSWMNILLSVIPDFLPEMKSYTDSKGHQLIFVLQSWQGKVQTMCRWTFRAQIIPGMCLNGSSFCTAWRENSSETQEDTKLSLFSQKFLCLTNSL